MNMDEFMQVLRTELILSIEVRIRNVGWLEWLYVGPITGIPAELFQREIFDIHRRDDRCFIIVLND